jgi:pyruvate carboxylase
MPLRKERNIAGDIMNPHRKKYSLEYYLKIAEQLVDHGVHTLAIKVAHA